MSLERQVRGQAGDRQLGWSYCDGNLWLGRESLWARRAGCKRPCVSERRGVQKRDRKCGWAQAPGSKLGSATNMLCDLGQLPYPLWPAAHSQGRSEV